MRRAQDASWRRLRAAGDAANSYRTRCGSPRDAGDADQAHQVARGRHHQRGFYHPITQCKLVARSTPNNNLTGLHMRISGPIDPRRRRTRHASPKEDATRSRSRDSTRAGTEGASSATTIPNLLIDHAMVKPRRSRPWFWRGVNNQTKTPSISSASWTSWPTRPGKMRSSSAASCWRKHPKHLAVLNAVAERRGLGQAGTTGQSIASLAQQSGLWQLRRRGGRNISVTDGNKIKIHRIVGATDPGPTAVNPAPN